MKLAVINGREVDPCVGSGFCCKKTICHEGMRVHGYLQGEQCPSLRESEWEGLTVYRCGLVEDASGEELERLDRSLSIGAGCCANLNTDRLPILRKIAQGSSLPSSTTSSETSQETP